VRLRYRSSCSWFAPTSCQPDLTSLPAVALGTSQQAPTADRLLGSSSNSSV
jgi:hypothetical protein